MDIFTIIFSVFSMVVAVAVLLITIFAVPITSHLAREKIFLFAPKKGSIVAVVLGERIVAYYANLEDQGKFVIQGSGVPKDIKGAQGDKDYILYLKTQENSFLWQHFGVMWLGFKRLFNYNISEGVVAESIYFKNFKTLEVKDCLTLEKAKVSFKIAFDLETVNAGLSLNYKDGAWLKKVEATIISAFREYISHISYADIPLEQVEHSLINRKSKKETADEILKAESMLTQDEKLMCEKRERDEEFHNQLLQRIIDLNNSHFGNPGLPEALGQKIGSFHITEVILSKEMMDISQKPVIAAREAEALKLKTEGEAVATIKKAEAAAKKTIIDAEADAKKTVAEAQAKATSTVLEADANAKAVAAVGNARNTVLEKTITLVPGERAADIEVAEKMSEALKTTSVQAISFGNGSVPFILNGQKKETKS